MKRIIIFLLICLTGVMLYIGVSQVKLEASVKTLTDNYISEFEANRICEGSSDTEEFLQCFYGISLSELRTQIKEIMTKKVKEDPDFKLTDFTWDKCMYKTDDYWYQASRCELIQGTINKIEQINNDTTQISMAVQKEYLEDTAPSDQSNLVKRNQKCIIRIRIPCNGLQYISPYWNLENKGTPLKSSELKKNQTI